ncbi:MAG: hypothetical protein FWG88_03020, partial [Oscillospiraceae bacterium]|nr:hypothetical protein [Oscillospiraceae bacterium]
NDYGGRVMDFGGDFITAEITGSSEKIERFIEQAKKVGILETCRSGLISMIQGTDNVFNIENLS